MRNEEHRGRAQERDPWPSLSVMSTFMVKVDFERPLGDGPHGLPPAIIQMTLGEHLPGVLALAVDRARLTNDGVRAYLMNGDGKREQETPPVYSVRFRIAADPNMNASLLRELLRDPIAQAVPKWFTGARLTSLSTGEDTTQ